MSDKGVDSGLARRLGALRQNENGFVRVEQIADVVGELLEQIEQDQSRHDRLLFQELDALSGYIKDIKADVVALRPDEIQSHYLPSATGELDAIVEATEAATNAILAAAERVEAVASHMDADSAEQLIEAITSIYEACTFQDITGQRIGKIVKALKVIQEKVDRLIVAFGADIDVLQTPPGEKPEERPANGDAERKLLNGPQRGDAVNRQDDVDALFSGSA